MLLNYFEHSLLPLYVLVRNWCCVQNFINLSLVSASVVCFVQFCYKCLDFKQAALGHFEVLLYANSNYSVASKQVH